MFECGLEKELEPFCSLALIVYERLNEEVALVGRQSNSYIGIAATETNEHEKSMLHKKRWLDSLLKRESASGELIEDYELGYAYNEIGVAYTNKQMLEEAAVAFLRSIEIFKSLGDEEDIICGLGWPKPNLGFVYWMQGKLEDAERELVEIRDIYARAYGVDDIRSFK
jgi:tetratricopeptide (TPR) repeat protein